MWSEIADHGVGSELARGERTEFPDDDWGLGGFLLVFRIPSAGHLKKE